MFNVKTHSDHGNEASDPQGTIIEWIEVSVIVVAAVGFVVGFILSVVLPPSAEQAVRSPLAAGHSIFAQAGNGSDESAAARAEATPPLEAPSPRASAFSAPGPAASPSIRPMALRPSVAGLN